MLVKRNRFDHVYSTETFHGGKKDYWRFKSLEVDKGFFSCGFTKRNCDWSENDNYFVPRYGLLQ